MLDGVDPGQPGSGRANPAARWERAHLLGPVLVAAFANSPLSEGRPHGWMSGRQTVWERLDPTRTTPVPVVEDPAAAWTDYLLDARLMLVGEEQKSDRTRMRRARKRERNEAVRRRLDPP